MKFFKEKNIKKYVFVVMLLLSSLLFSACANNERDMTDESAKTEKEENISSEIASSKDKSSAEAKNKNTKKATAENYREWKKRKESGNQSENITKDDNDYMHKPLPEIINASFSDGIVQIDGHIYQFDYYDNGNMITVQEMFDMILSNGDYYFDYTGDELIEASSGNESYGRNIGVYRDGVCRFKFVMYNYSDEIARAKDCYVSRLELLFSNYNEPYDISGIYFANGLCADGSNFNIDTIEDYLMTYDYNIHTEGDGYEITIDEPMGTNYISREYRFHFDMYGNGTRIDIYG